MSTEASSDTTFDPSGATDDDTSISATLADAGPDRVDTAAGGYETATSGSETATSGSETATEVSTETGDQTDGAEPAEGVGSVGATSDDVSLLVQEGDVAADYLEQFLDIVDYDGDIDLDVENGRAIVAIVGSDLDPLVGAGGTTLDALQELTRLAVQQKTGVRSRLMLDISGHRSNRRKQLTDLAHATAKTVGEDGQAVRLAPMNPFERKVVHDAISALDGVRSESEGDEPQRRVVVHPDR